MRRKVPCLKSRSSLKTPVDGTIVISKRLVSLLRLLRRFSRVQLDPVMRKGNGKISRISVDTLLRRALRPWLHRFAGQVVCYEMFLLLANASHIQK